MKKILMVHNYYQYRGGEDSVFENEVALLRKKGHTVETLTFHNNVINSPLATLQTGINLFYNQDAAHKTSALITDFQPDVLHAHNLFPIASPSVLYAAKKADIPTIVTLHNFRLICANALLFKNGQICEACIQQSFPLDGIRKGCYRDSKLQSAALTGMMKYHQARHTWHSQVDQFIVLTEFARQKFSSANLQLPLSAMTVKPNFVFDPGDTPSQNREDFILFIGRLSVEKDIETLLDTFRQTSVPLKIIGTGPFEDTVKQAAQNHPNIEYLGFQEKPSVLNWLNRSRAFILPSACYEGCPMTILEALSTGTPVLVSRIGGLGEFIRHEHNGLLFEPGNSADQAAQAERIATDDALHQTLCHNARQSYLSHYTPDASYQQLLAVYKTATQRAAITG